MDRHERGNAGKVNIHWFFCKLGFHRWIWYPDGLKCMDCGHFVSKEEVMADWQVGGVCRIG
jgi:hypothetical protein